MTLLKIVQRNMRQRLLATLLTTLTVTLGIALTVAILLIRSGMENRFATSTLGYEMVVGAKGSPLQLVLNTVFNLDISPGNISWDRLIDLRNDKRVKLAIPFSVGDNYKGFRIVGTTDTFFKEFDFGRGDHFEWAAGRIFQFSETALKEAFQEAAKRARERIAEEKGEAIPRKISSAEKKSRVAEAVLGSTVASDTGLKVGDSLIAAHGVVESPEAELHKDNPWKVVGILAPTHTACDRSIYINLDSFYHIEGHEVREKPGAKPRQEEKGSDPNPGQVSSIVLKLRSPIYAFPLYREINDRDDAMAAFPVVEIQKLFNIVGNIDRVLLTQAVLIVLVAGIGIAVSIYNSMSERRREIAIMRALGARRFTIFSIIVIEAALICAMGGVIGTVVGHGVVAAANPLLQQVSGFSVQPFQIQKVEPLVWVGCIFLGALCGLGPAIRAYKTPVAENLAPIS